PRAPTRLPGERRRLARGASAPTGLRESYHGCVGRRAGPRGVRSFDLHVDGTLASVARRFAGSATPSVLRYAPPAPETGPSGGGLDARVRVDVRQCAVGDGRLLLLVHVDLDLHRRVRRPLPTQRPVGMGQGRLGLVDFFLPPVWV